ncbi:MAG TPA: MFS transporter [Blastocatellia bacterium]|nr:MFS transporter [Blastocatellia bacterium]
MKKTINNLRWWITGLVFLSTVINYVDRQTLSVLAPRLSKELHLSNTDYGNISQAFLIPYTAMYIVAGILIDRYGTKLVYGVAAIWWSLAAMLHSLTSTFFGFSAVRFLLGTAESANFVAAQKVAAEWFPAKDRGTLNGWVQAGTVTGAIITAPVVVWMADRWGWRSAFLFTGALGLIWAIAWLWFYQLPENHPNITGEELALITADEATEASVAAPVGSSFRWVDFFRLPQTWGLLLARVISDPVWWFYLFWLPKYLTELQGLTEKQMSYVVWIPYLISDVGSIFGGWYSGKLIARKLGVVASRKVVMIISALMMPVGIILVLKPPVPLALVLISFVLGVHSAWKTNLVTLTVDIFPRHIVASVHGIVATGGGIGGALFQSFAGRVIDKYSYTPLLIMMGLLHPLAYLIVRWLVKSDSQATVANSMKEQPQ